MLYEFITLQRDAIIAKTRAALSSRPWPLATPDELENGVPLFLTQLSDILELELLTGPAPDGLMISSAARHGGELYSLGFNVSQVVHAYGDICQAITELAMEQNAPVTTREFHTLNRCLDSAIAEAVNEHARRTAEAVAAEEVEQLGAFAHELRNMLTAGLFAFHALKAGTVPINGSTGALLGRSLTGLRDLVDTTVAGIRMAATDERRVRLPLIAFLNDLAITASLDAEYRGLQFGMEPVDPDLTIFVDPQVLASSVMNLLTNALKFTPAGGHVRLRAHRHGTSVRIEIEDECGGIPDAQGDPFQPFGDRRGNDRSGLGLGLAIARKAARSHGGEITIRNTPGKGCVFVLELPLAQPEVPAATA